MKLWVDDERPSPNRRGWVHAMTSGKAIEALTMYRDATSRLDMPFAEMVEEISLDHDLGGEDNGMIVLDFMVESNLWPAVLTIHTANPPARQRMLATANRYGPEELEIFVKYW